MQMLTLFTQLFSELEQQAAEYAVWKNTQELPEALLGSGDIDLYVYPGSRPIFLAVLRKLRFIRLTSHKAFPDVDHYYGYDETSGKFAHLHCYFRMVTGESHIKQYVVPIEACLYAYPAVVGEGGIRSLHPVLQKKLNIFRRKIKLSCLPGALLFFRERRGYQLEKEMTANALLQKPSNPANKDVSHAAGWLDDIRESSSLVHEILDGLRYRYRYQQWNRFRPWLTPARRYGIILWRLHGKLSKRKKLLPMGLTVAISRADPANVKGDNNVNALVCQWMGKHFSTYNLTIGDQSGELADYLQRVQSESPANSADPGLSLQQIVTLARVARRWRRRVRQSVSLSTTGFLVIWEPVQIEELRRVVGMVSEAHAKASWIKRRLLQVSCESLAIEPVSDARLLVDCLHPADASNLDELVTVDVKSPAYGSRELFPSRGHSTCPTESVPGETFAGHYSVEHEAFKTTLWKTIADMQ